MADLPSLNGLRAFEAAARHLSFTRAAEELHVTQAAISHQISRLEAQLGLRLFRRRNRALVLTEEAQAYLPAVRAAFEGLRAATRTLRRQESGTLTVTAMTSFAALWLVPRLGAFQARHPEIEIRLSTSFQQIDLRREDVDVAVRMGDGTWPGHRVDWLMPEALFPVCSPALLERGPPLQVPADLAQHTLLHCTVWPDGWTNWLAAAGQPGLRGVRNPSYDLLLSAYQAAMQGAGVAMGLRTHIEADLAAGRLVRPFTVALPEKGYYVVAPEETADRPKIRAFRAWLQEVAGAAESPGVDSAAAGSLQPPVIPARGRAGRSP
jgi:LysR family glycine cleavage system transcriptional activator